MQNYTVKVGKPVEVLATASQLITDSNTEQAHKLLDELLDNLDPQDDITKLCAMALRYRNKTEIPMYRRDLEEDDKQINVFDLVLQCVPPVRVVTMSALQVMKDLYASGVSSFTHVNIGIGKGRFEIQLLKELAQLDQAKQLKHIKIVGIDIDNDSLRETGEAIQHIADTLFSEEVRIEYTPIFAFAESITADTWQAIREHDTDVLGMTSAFTLHHIPTQEQRQHVIDQISGCDPTLFMLLEPDSDHFNPNLAERVVNCWNHFGKVFELIDQNDIPRASAKALKYKFFGREIEDILSNEESQRSEKHEPSQRWIDRLERADFTMHNLTSPEALESLLGDAQLDIAHNIKHKFMGTQYKGVPMVAMFAGSKFM